MKKQFLFVVCLIALVSSCSKDQINVSKSPVVRKELTPDEKILKDKLALTAQIVRDAIISSPELVKEVEGFINLKKHSDDFVFFKDLFYPESSVYKGTNKTETKFAKVFDELISSKSDYKDTGNLKEFLVSNDVAVYCPYPVEDYASGIQGMAVTSDPVDNDVENMGYAVADDGTYSEVTVDEEYTLSAPVWIVSQEEDATSPVPNITPSGPVNQLRVGWVKATKQYDWLFAGGSEFKFCLIGGTITMNTASSFSCMQTCYLSRAQIRNQLWVNFQYELDDDWYVSPDGTTDEGSRQFGLIEYDPWLTTFTLAFEPKVKIGGVEVSALKLELKITSSDDWIKLDKFLSRETFKKFNQVDMGNGLQDGYRVYAAGNVYWTLPLIEY